MSSGHVRTALVASVLLAVVYGVLALTCMSIGMNPSLVFRTVGWWLLKVVGGLLAFAVVGALYLGAMKALERGAGAAWRGVEATSRWVDRGYGKPGQPEQGSLSKPQDTLGDLGFPEGDP